MLPLYKVRFNIMSNAEIIEAEKITWQRNENTVLSFNRSNTIEISARWQLEANTLALALIASGQPAALMPYGGSPSAHAVRRRHVPDWCG